MGKLEMRNLQGRWQCEASLSKSKYVIAGVEDFFHRFVIMHSMIDVRINTGWWFGTFFLFPYIGNFIIPTDELIYGFGSAGGILEPVADKAEFGDDDETEADAAKADASAFGEKGDSDDVMPSKCLSEHDRPPWLGHTARTCSPQRRLLGAATPGEVEKAPALFAWTHAFLQGGAPKIAKLVYNFNNYGLW